MSLKSQTKKIDGSTYWTNQMLPRKALSMSIRLVKICGPALGALKGSKFTSLSSDDQAETALSVVQEAFAGVNDQEAVQLLEDMIVGQVNKDGTLINDLDQAFLEEGMVTMFKVFMFTLEVNFKGFFTKSSSSENPNSGIAEG